MKWPRREALPLSREGVVWFIISFAMFVTGLLKGINLITLLACWMVILVFVNFRWAYPQLRAVTAERFFPEAAFAGTPFPYVLQVENKGRQASLGISVHDAGPEHQLSRFLPRLEAGARATFDLQILFNQRGRQQLSPLRITTGYPLALVHLAKSMPQAAALVVFPRLGILQRGTLGRFLAQHSPTLGQARAFPRRHPGAQTEFHGLRPFRPGDSTRWIHWRTTARRGELMVRDFEDMPTDHLVLIVDPGLTDSPVLERLLSFAATICWEWCRQKGNRLAVALAGLNPTTLAGNSSREFAYAALERLALAQPGLTANAEFLEALANEELPPGPILVLSVTASSLADEVATFLHRSVAQLNLGNGDDRYYFEEMPIRLEEPK